MDARDWFVMILVALVWVAATAWIFVHASDTAFGLWCGLCATIGGIYHWLVIRDSKIKDAE